MTAWTFAGLASIRRASRGFTLIEVLIATSLLALLSILVLAGLRFGMTAWRKGEDAAAGVEQASFAHDLLRRAIEGAYPSLVGGAVGAQVVDFDGSATVMSFVGPAPQSALSAGRARLTVRAASDGEEVRLEIEIRPELARAGDDAVIIETLAEGLASAKFSYLAEGETAWRETWANEARLPALVRIEAEMKGGDRRSWLPMIAAPRIGVDVACRYDPLTKYCQGRRR